MHPCAEEVDESSGNTPVEYPRILTADWNMSLALSVKYISLKVGQIYEIKT